MGIVDEGALRPPERALLQDLPPDSRFSQLCLRKLYVLCSRGAEASAPQGCLLQVQGSPTCTSIPLMLVHSCAVMAGHRSRAICVLSDFRLYTAGWHYPHSHERCTSGVVCQSQKN